MPDIIDATGLTVQTAAEITANLVAGLQTIYGVDINVDQNSPDGQWVGILTQMGVDIRELAVAVNAGFDPDQAVGAILDQRVTINNIQRIGGTYTVQPIDITVNTTVALQGLDGNFSDPNGTGYTVQDSAGNQFILSASVTLTAGTSTQDFRAQQIGQVNVPIDTITNPVTIIPGVVSVNNSSAAISVGQNQETDGQLRLRRQKSIALASNGYLNGLLGTVLALPGVTEAVLYENATGTTDANGIPGHSIWLVVAGGATSDIANALYGKKSAGSGMKGAITFDITTASGALFVAKWDNPSPEPLYIKFTIKTTVTGFSFDQTAIKTTMANNLAYGIGAFADTSEPTLQAVLAIAAQGGGGVPVLMQISNDGSSWTDYLTPTDVGTQFTVAIANIDITVVP